MTSFETRPPRCPQTGTFLASPSTCQRLMPPLSRLSRLSFATCRVSQASLHPHNVASRRYLGGASQKSRSLSLCPLHVSSLVRSYTMKRSAPPSAGSISPPLVKRKIESTTTSMIERQHPETRTNKMQIRQLPVSSSRHHKRSQRN